MLDGSTKSCGHTKRQNGLDHIDNFNGMRDRQNKYNTNLEVIRNQKMQPNNTSGVKGVSYHNGRKEWRARVSVGGKEICKWFKNKDDAIRWRQEAEDTYYKPKIDQAIKNGDLKESKETRYYQDFNENKETSIERKLIDKLKSLGYQYTYRELGWYDKDDNPITEFSSDEFGDWEPKDSDWYYTRNARIFRSADDTIEFSWDIDENRKTFTIITLWAYKGAKKGEATRIMEMCLNMLPNDWKVEIKDNIAKDYWNHIQSRHSQLEWENVEESFNW